MSNGLSVYLDWCFIGIVSVGLPALVVTALVDAVGRGMWPATGADVLPEGCYPPRDRLGTAAAALMRTSIRESWYGRRSVAAPVRSA